MSRGSDRHLLTVAGLNDQLRAIQKKQYEENEENALCSMKDTNALDNLHKASNTIRKWIENNARGKSLRIELPEYVTRQVRREMGRDFVSHNITANGIIHALKNHGVGGKKLTEKSIPIRKEDAELIPYIMAAPSYVRKGSTKNNRESVRYYKTISNGYVVVIEKELDNSVDDLETINMWAELSDVSNAASTTLNRTPETTTISRSDIAKIIKDAETAIGNEQKMRYSLKDTYYSNAEKAVLNISQEKATPDQWVTVRTKAFKNWFGDWELPNLWVDIIDASHITLLMMMSLRNSHQQSYEKTGNGKLTPTNTAGMI